MNTGAQGHLVRRCTWDARFDDAARGPVLLDRLSRLSANVLPAILAECMDGVRQPLRLPALALELGTVRADELETRLPGMLRAALARALAEAAADAAVIADAGDAGPDDAADADLSHAVLRYFLEHGDMPWWARGKTSHLAALEQELAASGTRLALMLRQVGKHASARKRMARQWKEQHLRQVVARLEPQHHRLVIAFADRVCEVHERAPAGLHQDGAFRQHRWFWILTHLLVERGTFFNTVAFVASTVRQMAAHLNMGYELLLSEIAAACTSAQTGELATPAFIRAIGILQKQAEGGRQVAGTQDYWPPYLLALQRPSRLVRVAGRVLGFAEVHAQLLQEDPERLIGALRALPPAATARFLAAALPGRQQHELMRALAGTHFRALRALLRSLRSVALPAAVTSDAALLREALAYLLATDTDRIDIHACARSVIASLAPAQAGARAMLTLALARHELGRTAGDGGLALALFGEVLAHYEVAPQSAAPAEAQVERWLGLALRHYLERGTIVRHFPMRARRRHRELLQTYLLAGEVRPPYVSRAAAGRRETWARLLDLAGAGALPPLLQRLCGNGHSFVLRLFEHWADGARKGLWSGSLAHDFSHGFHLAGLAAAHAVAARFTPALFLDALMEALDRHGVMRPAAFVACVRHVLAAAGGNEWAALSALHAWIHDKAASLHTVAQPSAPAQSPCTVARSHEAAHRERSFAALAALLLQGRYAAGTPDADTLFRGALRESPGRLRALLRANRDNAALGFRLATLVDSLALLEAVGRIPRRREAEARQLQAFIGAARRAQLQGIADKDLDLAFRETLLQHWFRAESGPRFALAVVRNFAERLLLRHRVPREQLLKWLDRIARHVPARLLAELKRILQGGRAPAATPPRPARRASAAPPNRNRLFALDGAAAPAAGLDSREVNNAGLVLVADYVKPYFQRLGLTRDDAFVSDDARLRAVHYLQFLATGASATEEQHLKLNKLLCGLALDEPVPAGVALAEGEAQLAESLLQAMIGYWKAIGTCSVDGFRGNWLVREGMLAEQKDNWALAVARRSYDVLLNKAPFGFSVIRYPWMPKPIYTAWSY